MSKSYLVNEIFYTLQGEGVRYGIPHVFVRLAQCNLTCSFCDTEFKSYVPMTTAELMAELMAECQRVASLQTSLPVILVRGAHKPAGVPLPVTPCRQVHFCGGEPLLQLDDELGAAFHAEDDRWFTCVETNGTQPIPAWIDWSVCSPKVAEHAIVPQRVNELKYIRGYGQGIPRPLCQADYYLISPCFNGDLVEARTLEWCVKLVLDNPGWRLSVQHHKISFGGIR